MNNAVTHSLLLAMMMMVSLSSCTQLELVLPRYSDNAIQTVHLVATDDVNQSTAVAVDIVFLFEDTLVTQLSKYTARQWFTERRQFQLQYPGKFVVFSYELVPVSQVILKPDKEHSKFPIPYQKAYKVLLFANYLKESPDYTLDISPFKKPRITLDKAKIDIVETK